MVEFLTRKGVVMSMINKKGFTLIELLAAMVILGMIMVIAIPNITGILNNSRNQTYVEDAKKFISMAEYKFRTDKNMAKPTEGSGGTIDLGCVFISLSYLDKSEFKDAPNGSPYLLDKSLVIVRLVNNTYEYRVILLDSDGKGVINKTKEELYNSKSNDLITKIDLNNTNELEGPRIINSANWLFKIRGKLYSAKTWYAGSGIVPYSL